jgi:hypothetical protein
MRYYAARQMKNGKWHYTCRGDYTYAVGHCSPITTCPECEGRSMFREATDPDACGHCQNKGIVKLDNPCPGHDTAEEACEHYRQYQLDTARYNGHDAESQEKCAVCQEWTQEYAVVDGWHHYRLCDKHRNREGLEKVHGKVGESWES